MDAVIVARSGEHRPVRSLMPMGIHLGARLPAFATSTGRVLLAGLDAVASRKRLQEAAFFALTPHTLTSKRLLALEIARVREQGFCYASQEHELGLHALAVAIRDTAGQVVAALNVVQSPMVTAPSDYQRRYLPLLLQAAGEARSLM